MELRVMLSVVSSRAVVMLCDITFFFFFFQAEDGIRDLIVTGVQTCALPIYVAAERAEQHGADVFAAGGRHAERGREREGHDQPEEHLGEPIERLEHAPVFPSDRKSVV